MTIPFISSGGGGGVGPAGPQGPQGPAGADGADGADGGGGTTIVGRQHMAGSVQYNPTGSPAQGSLATFGSITTNDFLTVTFEQPSGLVISKGTASGGQARNGYFKIPSGQGGIYRVKGSICANIPHKRVKITLSTQTPAGAVTMIADSENDMPAVNTGLSYPNNAMAHTAVYQVDTLAQIDALDEVFMQILVVHGDPTPSSVVRVLGGTTRNYFEIQKI